MLEDLFRDWPTSTFDGGSCATKSTLKYKIRALRAIQTRWQQRQLAAATSFHRDVAQDKIDWYENVIAELKLGQERPRRPQPPARTETWHIYRHFDEDGRLLYVGKTGDWLGRNDNHRRNAPWYDEVVNITVTRFPMSEDMTRAEAEAIAKEKPLYNLLLQRLKNEPVVQHRLWDF
jgi:hypothetical protein